ncbi:MAG: hypothetical protein ACXAEU_01435 [Candidatus Hodarchaeales archaeon]|jgi:hypothetical protein
MLPKINEELKSFHEFNEDQLKILNLLRDTSDLFPNDAGLRGATWKLIMKETGLSVEKTLLSLGWLEAQAYITHDVGIETKTLSYLGHSDVPYLGQKTVRMFYLTEKGDEAAKHL